MIKHQFGIATSSILVQLVEQIAIGTGIELTVTIEGTPLSVKPETGIHLLRITQESINNALRHAGTTAISLRLSYKP
jgi:signal transduction histidine kinase